MPGVNLLRTPGPANVFRVAGLELPGVAVVTGCVDSRKLDVQGAKGAKGATIVYSGSDPQEFEVKLVLVEPEDYDAWIDGEAAGIVRASPDGKNPKAFAVDHPACLECGITAALTKTYTQATKRDDGAYEVTIKMLPSQPPKASSGTPKGSATQWKSSTGGGTAQPPDAQSEADKKIEELTKQIKGGG